MKIAVVGTGYVGLSNAVLLSQHHEVIAVDILKEKVELINNKISPIRDWEIEDFLKNKKLNLVATTDYKKAYIDADFIIIATPTNYDEETNYFNTSSIESVIKEIQSINKAVTIVIKSTVPVGYTEKVKEMFNKENIIFVPEFLREGKALYDNLYPSRIIVGSKSEEAYILANIFKEAAMKKDVELLFTGSTEAEAIKLFSNTYLAMRIAYFNELDTYAKTRNLDTKEIINGVSLDSRIGDYYNNPSFGYGGYCLPKDTKQLRANYKDIPNNLIGAIVDSNKTRKEFIINDILKSNPKKVGIYKLVMKKDSDNFRESSIQDIMLGLVACGVEVVIYEPRIKDNKYQNLAVIKDETIFKNTCDLIITNRVSNEFLDIKEKIYSRDIFNRD